MENSLQKRRYIKMARKVLDCRDFPGHTDCTVTIIGEEIVILPLMTYHAIKDHGDEKDSPELQQVLIAMLKDE
jgi:hypothetical protein